MNKFKSKKGAINSLLKIKCKLQLLQKFHQNQLNHQDCP